MLKAISRRRLIDTLTAGVRGHPAIRAAWLGGSDAFGRADDLSDIDLCLCADDAHIEAAFTAVECAILTLSPISHRFRLPQPTWHGHDQAFYRLAYAPPTLLVDLVVFASSRPNQFRERERHGAPVVLFGPEAACAPTPLDRETHQAKVSARLQSLRQSFPIFESFVPKELDRGRFVDAAAFYQSLTLRPLADLLRIAHCPDRFDFGMRYLSADLPADVFSRFDPLVRISGPEDLRAKHRAAGAMFRAALLDLDSQSGHGGV